ncbi:MAG: hypothetical protein H7251_09160 [Acetobacteraceae bacterium]|nr:hypothetical protein [Acetobacteraceae bacterium]
MVKQRLATKVIAEEPPNEDNPTAHDASAKVIQHLKMDNQKIDALFAQYFIAEDDAKSFLIREITEELTMLSKLREDTFYPALEGTSIPTALINGAHVAYDIAKLMSEELMAAPPADKYRDAKVGMLAQQFRHQVALEEQAEDGLFAKAEEAGINDGEVVIHLQERRAALELEQNSGTLTASPKITFQQKSGKVSYPQEDNMDNNRTAHDERGRFTSDDHNDNRQSERASATRSSNGGGRSSENDRNRGSSSDERGWHGDSQGHAEAARRGWETRHHEDDRGRSGDGGGARSSRNDDGRSGNGSSGSRNDNSEQRTSSSGSDRDRDERGRYTSEDDHRGNQRSTSMGDDHNGNRGRQLSNDRGRDDHGRYASDADNGGDRRSMASRDDGDRGRSASNGGQGGWFGDSEGHAQAARSGAGNSSRSGGGQNDRDDRGRFTSDDDGRDNRRVSNSRDDHNDNRDRQSAGGNRAHDSLGRFTSDDQHRGASRPSNSQDDHRDNRGGASGNDRERDDRGRFTSEDDQRGGRSSSASRGDSDRGNSSNDGRSHGGWFGDSEGHAEAARRGAQSRH